MELSNIEWTNIEDGLPALIDSDSGTFKKSKKVCVLINDIEPLIAEMNFGVDPKLGEWYQWYCPAYEDVVEGVTKWCDCIPEIPQPL